MDEARKLLNMLRYEEPNDTTHRAKACLRVLEILDEIEQQEAIHRSLSSWEAR